MTTYSIILFLHVASALGLFASLSFELLSLFHLRRASDLPEVRQWIDPVPGLPVLALSGFVEGFIYESTDGGSRHNIVTTAVWKDEDAFQNAKKSAAEEFQRIGFNPLEIMKMLKVEIERGESTVDHRIDYHAAERRFAS
jgi:heme-degrading monooxygenase HmoA